jgi:hypothetical protein
MTRLSKPQNAGTAAEERFWEKLGIDRRKAQNASQMLAGRSSFIRPHSKEIKVRQPAHISLKTPWDVTNLPRTKQAARTIWVLLLQPTAPR